MKLNSIASLVLTAVLALGVAGCKKKMDRVTPLPGYGAAQTIKEPGPDRPGGNGLNLPPLASNNNNPNGMNNGDGTGAGRDVKPVGPNDVVPLSDKRSIEGRQQDHEKYRAQTVYFDFDRSNVRSSEAHKVQEVADRFKAEDQATDLLIEGHCDERGTEGYNQALGERRALAIREMLVSLGVPADRVHTVSFGKDKPADPGHSESAYSKNRRGEFVLILAK